MAVTLARCWWFGLFSEVSHRITGASESAVLEDSVESLDLSIYLVVYLILLNC